MLSCYRNDDEIETWFFDSHSFLVLYQMPTRSISLNLHHFWRNSANLICFIFINFILSDQIMLMSDQNENDNTKMCAMSLALLIAFRAPSIWMALIYMCPIYFCGRNSYTFVGRLHCCCCLACIGLPWISANSLIPIELHALHTQFFSSSFFVCVR